MRALLIVAICYLVTGTAVSQTGRERDGLKGPVKTVRVRQVTLITENGLQTEAPVSLVTVVTYDQSGRKTEIALYDRDNILSRRIVYDYDPETKMRSGLTTYNSQNVVVRKVTDKYGAKNGFKISSQIQAFNEDGTLYKRTEVAFGPLGELVEVSEYNGDGTPIKKPNSPKGSIDENPNLARREEEERLVGWGTSIKEYFYEDSHGNWTRGNTGSIVRTYASGRKVKTEEWTYREFTYY
jgi:hypothetical protein